MNKFPVKMVIYKKLFLGISLLFFIANLNIPVYSQVVPVKTLADKNVSLSVEKLHEFSFPGKKDKFQITLNGKNVFDGNIIFKIIDYSGKEIYNIPFHGKDLLGDMPDQKTKKQQEEYIIKRVKNFFSDDKFKKPAIKADEKFDTDYSDKTYWNEIKNDKSATAFFYLIGYEDGRHIAFSKKTKKVVLFFNCC